MADLAAWLGVEPASIAVERVEQVTWPNAGLGCPPTGRTFAPEPVPGYRIVLRVGDLEYRYHGALDGDGPILCLLLD